MALASGLVVWPRLCRGHTSGQRLVGPALEALRQRLPRLDPARLDGGPLSAKVLNGLVEERAPFLIEAGCKLASIRHRVERSRPEQWRSYDEEAG